MKGLVIFVIILFISMPISFAKEVSISKLFEVEYQPTSISVPSSPSKEIYYYAGYKLIAVDDEYQYQGMLNTNIKSKALPFGQEVSNQERFSFTGKELDSDLYYFNARYYDSNLGTFTSVDPVPSEPSYQYVYNNPLRFTDPTGTQTGLEVAATESVLLGAEEAYMVREGGRLLQQGLTSTPKPGPWAWLGAAAAGVGTFLTIMLWAAPLNSGEDEWLAMQDSTDPYSDYHYKGDFGPQSEGYPEWIEELNDAPAPTKTSNKGRPPVARVTFMIAYLPGVDANKIYPFLSTLGSLNKNTALLHSTSAMSGAPVTYNMAESALNILRTEAQSSIHYSFGDGGNMEQLLTIADDYLLSVTTTPASGGSGLNEMLVPTLLYSLPSHDEKGAWGLFIMNKNLPAAGAAASRNAAY
jgi:RHS repeat-associated protein